MKKIVIVALFALLAVNAFASVKRVCKVRYRMETGWSKEYTMEVEFATGSELNEKTSSFKYDPYSQYALLWFKDGGVAVLKISDYTMGVNEIFSSDDFRKVFDFKSDVNCVQVNSDDRTKWIIKARESIAYIDPREN